MTRHISTRTVLVSSKSEKAHTGMVVNCSKARSLHALLMRRSFRPSDSLSTGKAGLAASARPLGNWNRLVGPWKEMRPSSSTVKPSMSRESKSTASLSSSRCCSSESIDEGRSDSSTFNPCCSCCSVSPPLRLWGSFLYFASSASSFAMRDSRVRVYDSVGVLQLSISICLCGAGYL